MSQVVEPETEDDPLYCICRKPYNRMKPMVECEPCGEWFHFECIGVPVTKMNNLKNYICTQCDPNLDSNERFQMKPKPKPKFDSQPQKSKDRCLNCKKKYARVGSSYCSHDCGIAYAVELLKAHKRMQNVKLQSQLEKQITEMRWKVMKMVEEEQSAGQQISLPEQEDIKIISDVKKELEELQKSRDILAREKAKVARAMARARDPSKIREPAGGRPRNRRPQTVGSMIGCVGCGKQIAYAGYARHAVSCFTRLEHDEVTSTRPTESEDGSQIVHCDYYDPSTTSYCKKLKASCVRHSGFSSYRSKKKETVKLCGCPLTTGEYCPATRVSCMKHLDWENIKQANILLLELTYMQTEKQLKFEEKVTGKRMVLRRGLIDKSDLESQDKKDEMEVIEDKSVQELGV